MGCVSCGTKTGKPTGCKSNGNCSTGGCNMMNSYDWLADLPIAFGNEQSEFYEISFNNGSRKEFYKNEHRVSVNTGDLVVVETGMGFDIGRLSLSGDLVKLQMKKKKVKERGNEFRNIIRLPNEKDLEKWEQATALEMQTMVRARAITKQYNLDMKIGMVEFQADRKKATFYYTAEDRVDFRDLIKEFAKEFKVKVEMRQIGSRQEAAKIGGIGSCGRELCCSTWLTDFKSVSTNAARYQNISINLSKLSGQCGRLKCCLNYELDTYMEAFEEFPKKAEKLSTDGGTAFLQKTDILQRMMWYTYADNPNYYPVTVEKVNELLLLNKEGKKAPSLNLVAYIDDSKVVEEEIEYEDTVGHITLSALEKTKSKKNSRRNKKKPSGNNSGGNQQNRTGGNQPNRSGGNQPNKAGGNPQANAGGKAPENKGNSGDGNKPSNRNKNKNRRNGGKKPGGTGPTNNNPAS